MASRRSSERAVSRARPSSSMLGAGRWKNFQVWKRKLPHWRADGVLYYVTFRHRRELTQMERGYLLRALVHPDGRRWDLLIACVLPETTELLFKVLERPNGRPYELSAIVEKAKTKVGQLITKNTGERYSPFYSESFDRIVRDEQELQEKWHAILESPCVLGLAEVPERYADLWVSGA
jgi:putative transposase